MMAPSEEINGKSTQGTWCWKVRSVGCNAVADNGSMFIRLAVVASKQHVDITTKCSNCYYFCCFRCV